MRRRLLFTGSLFRRFSKESRGIKDSHPSSSSGSGDTVGILFFGSLCATTFGLGVWQVKRYQEKTSMIEQSLQLLREPPIPLTSEGGQADLASSVAGLRGRLLTVEGEYLHEREVLLGIRSAPPDLVSPKAEGLAVNPQGYFVITPLRLPDGSVLFVNRGWVSRRAKDWERPKGRVKATVVASSCEKRSTFSPTNDTKSRTLLWLEGSSLLAASGVSLELNEVAVVECVGSSLPLIPAVADGVLGQEGSSEVTFPATRKTSSLIQHYVTPEVHATYAATWFSLCLFGVGATFYKYRRVDTRVLSKLKDSHTKSPPDISS